MRTTFDAMVEYKLGKTRMYGHVVVPLSPLALFTMWLDARICQAAHARARGLIPIVGLRDEHTVCFRWPAGRPMPELVWIVRCIRDAFPEMEIDTHSVPACVVHEDCVEVVRLGRECWKSRHP